MNILRPAVLLDKDGTLVHDLPHNVVQALAHAREGTHALRAARDALVVGTNHSGVARGLFAPEALAAVRARLEDLLGLPLDGFHGCPHHPDGSVAAHATDRARRKPAPGLLLRAAAELGLDLRRSWRVDDILHDIEAGSRAGGRTALLLGGGETEWLPGPHRRPTLQARELDDAARCMLGAPRRPTLVQVPAAIKRTIKATTIVQATADYPANKAPAIGHSLLATIDAFTRLRVLVIGEAMLDSYLDGHSERRCREPPVPVAEFLRRIAAVTRDAAGGLVCVAGQPAYRTFTRPSPDAHATGAGDPLVSALALATGATTLASADLAACAAALALRRGGTTACTAAELRLQLGDQRKVVPAAELAALADELRRAGKRIVFTSGCFDILHRGHISHLGQARALGDALIVGLDADASVRRLKGASRPINRADDRAHIVEFAEDTPMALIERARPDIYIKSGDYTRDTLPEAPLVERLGGQVRLLPYLEQFSAIDILARIGERGARRRASK